MSVQTRLHAHARSLRSSILDFRQSILQTSRFLSARGLDLQIEGHFGASISPVEIGWRVVAESFDPQILLTGFPPPMAQRGSAVLLVEAVAEDLSRFVNPEVYLDRGLGFGDHDRVPLTKIAGDRWAAYIQDLKTIVRLRFDPSEGPVAFTLRRVALRAARASDAGLLSAAETPSSLVGINLPGVTMDGVRLLSLSGIERDDAKSGLRLVDNDPQFVFELTPMSVEGPAIARLTFRFTEGEHLITPRAYVAYGDAEFDHDRSFFLKLQQDQSHQLVIALPALGARVRWDPSEKSGFLRLTSVSVAQETLAGAGEAVAEAISAPVPDLQILTAATADSERLEPWRREALALTVRLNTEGLNHGAGLVGDYPSWIKSFDDVPTSEYPVIYDMIRRMPIQPKFSFILPTYNPPVKFLRECVFSLLNQVYLNFEICIADDCSTNPEVIEFLKWVSASDPRVIVKLRSENGHISEASNSAIELATGDYLVLADHDDIIPSHCLAVVAEYINRYPDAEIFFSDEDKLSINEERIQPYFKSSFNEYLMFGHNMVSHIGVYKRSLINEIGGFRKGYEGSQDYDLLLRGLEKCGPAKIVHIPHVLYHWRILPGSTALSSDQKSYAIVAAQRSLNDYFRKKGFPYHSIEGGAPGLSGLAVDPPEVKRRISIVIPTRDQVDLLSACITSILSFPDEALEIIVVDNGSAEDATLAYLQDLEQKNIAVVVPSPGSFNFSHLCNVGVEASTGDIICLLNNDTEVLSTDWLDRARGHLSVPAVGVVGARLFYPDRTLQHFGLYLGLGGHRIAGTPHRGLSEMAFGYFGKARLIQEFSAVTAACLFVRRSDYLAVHGFDEALAVAYNDVDFCLKLQDRGLKVICDPAITLIHKESKSRGSDKVSENARRLEDEAEIMRARWGDRLDDDPYYSPNLTLDGDDMTIAIHPRVQLPWRETA